MPLAIVVVNYGSAQLLETNLVRTVEGCAPYCVVVVDNYSTDEERVTVAELCQKQNWTLVTPNSNLGFGGGVNRGVAAASKLGATDFLLLNPDAHICGDSVSVLLEAIAESRRMIVAPRIVDSSNRRYFAGADIYLSDGSTRSRARRVDYPGEEHWEWLTGACMLIPYEIWVRTGGFDEDYFLYWEDVDFSRRVVNAGGSVMLVEDAIAVHDEGGTQEVHKGIGNAKSTLYYYYNIRNRMLFAAKHLDGEGMKRWQRGAWRSAKEVVLRGGRRQLIRPWGAVGAAYRGVRDGRKDVSQALRLIAVQGNGARPRKERST